MPRSGYTFVEYPNPNSASHIVAKLFHSIMFSYRMFRHYVAYVMALALPYKDFAATQLGC